MKHRLLLLPFLLLLGAAPALKLEVQERHGKSYIGTIDGFPLLMLRGTQRERGEAHGRLGAATILAMLDEALIPSINRRAAGAWDRDYVKEAARYAFPARFEEELAAMIDGLRAARPKPEDRVLKSLGREITVGDLKAVNCLSDIMGAGCSSFSAWGALTADGAPVIGRNLDYYAFPLASKTVLLATEPAEKELKATVDVLLPGFIGVGTAMNAEGVFLALHDEQGLSGGAMSGWVPRSVALRAAIEGASAVKDVAASLKGLPVRVGNNVHVCGPTGPAAVLEWDGNAKDGGLTQRGPEGKTERLVCTNHYCTRRKADSGGDSGGRYTSIARGLEALEAAGRKLDLDASRKLLEGVGRDGGLVTHLSIVAWPASRRWTFSVSPQTAVSALKGRWIALEWKDVFGN
jgi:hypothetical protein